MPINNIPKPKFIKHRRQQKLNPRTNFGKWELLRQEILKILQNHKLFFDVIMFCNTEVVNSGLSQWENEFYNIPREYIYYYGFKISVPARDIFRTTHNLMLIVFDSYEMNKQRRQETLNKLQEFILRFKPELKKEILMA